MALYRIPLAAETGRLMWIDDLDLAMLLQHSGESRSVDFRRLAARDPQGKPLAVQWLPSSAPSAVPGQKRGTLIVAPSAAGSMDLLLPMGGESVRLVRAEADQGAGVQIKETADDLAISVEGKPFFTYRFNTKPADHPRPYFHPLLGPGGQTISQLGEVPGKREKHFHHTALWIAHQNFQAKGETACDNWQIGRPNSSRIDHEKFDVVETGPLAGRFVERLRWLNVKGDKVLLAETRTATIPKRPAGSRVIDLDLVLKGQDAPVTLLKTPYHLVAVRVLDALLPKNGGAITNSDGKKNPGDGTPAKWIDISGKLGDDWQGVALFNHPENARHPVPCLQFAGQTIGLSPTHKEPLTIEPGKEFRFRCRVLVHAGNVEDGKVADEYEAYSKPGKTRLGGPERVIT